MFIIWVYLDNLGPITIYQVMLHIIQTNALTLGSGYSAGTGTLVLDTKVPANCAFFDHTH